MMKDMTSNHLDRRKLVSGPKKITQLPDTSLVPYNLKLEEIKNFGDNVHITILLKFSINCMMSKCHQLRGRLWN